MSNDDFNAVLASAYRKYLETGARSNEKLKVLHGAISEDLQKKLGGGFQVKSLGVGDGKEVVVGGKYYGKKVDIAVLDEEEKVVASIAVKYVMSNYFQNANNYFESMLGETANLRMNNQLYFQMVIVPKCAPYFKKDGDISRKEILDAARMEKYLALDRECTTYAHVPLKTLVYVINTPDFEGISNKSEYEAYLMGLDDIEVSVAQDEYECSGSVIYNDYAKFIEKVTCCIKGLCE